jgi:hypothetical protein
MKIQKNGRKHMPKFLKWFGIVVGVLLVLVLISGFGLHILGKNRLNQAPQLATHPVPVPQMTPR